MIDYGSYETRFSTDLSTLLLSLSLSLFLSQNRIFPAVVMIQPTNEASK